MTGTATSSGAQVVTAQAGTGSIAHDAEDAAALGAIQGAGASSVRPDPKDKRFADPA